MTFIDIFFPDQAPLVEITFLTLATYAASWAKNLVETTGKAEFRSAPLSTTCFANHCPSQAPRSDIRANDAAFYGLLTGILKTLVLLRRSDLEKTMLFCWPAYSSTASGPMHLKSPRSSRLSKLLYKLHCRPLDGAYPIVLNRNPASHLGST